MTRDEAKLEQLRQLVQSQKVKEVQERSDYTAPPEIVGFEMADNLPVS